MSFDPLAIYEYHDKVRAKIEAGESSFAQSVLDDVMVSYESASFRGPMYGYDPIAFGTTPRVSAMLEKMIIDSRACAWDTHRVRSDTSRMCSGTVRSQLALMAFPCVYCVLKIF